jgi:hypothetical protein
MSIEKASTTENNREVTKIVRRLGNTTYEVHVFFSKTSKETLADKIMRLIQNDIHSANLS